MLWVILLQVLRPSVVAPVMPLADSPARDSVHGDLAEPLEDPGLPHPTKEDLDGV